MAKTIPIPKTPRIAPAAEPAHAVPEYPVPWWGWLGLIVLLLGACAWGVLEVHSSTDTWIGLAAGRQILSEPNFPLRDTFSYTSGGAVWFNQNWLSHVYLWLLYYHLGPNAVIFGTWAIAAAFFLFVGLATYFRTASPVAGIITAAAVGIGTRDWVSARPATVQFFLMAAMWLCVSALVSQGPRRRWWPVAMLVPIFFAWPHAHGSFTFGYGLLGMAVAITGVWSLFQWPALLSARQVLAIAAVVIVTVLLAVALGPFGLDNFTHQFKVAESRLFREVGEWHSPIRYLQSGGKFDPFPPVLRFWLVLGFAVLTPVSVLVARGFSRSLAPPPEAAARRRIAGAAPQAGAAAAERWGRLQLIALDIASIAAGLAMAFWARRFAPMFYILAGPAITTWTLRWARGLPEPWRRFAHQWVLILVLPVAAAVVFHTTQNARKELLPTPANPNVHGDLLTRVTQYYQMPYMAIDWVARNHVAGNYFTEWKVAGNMMFWAPEAKQYIDGRSQQVYTEEQYVRYLVLKEREARDPLIWEYLEGAGTDAVLLPNWPAMNNLRRACDLRFPHWIPAYHAHDATIWYRAGSAVFRDLAQRELAGALWWPDDAFALARRAMLHFSAEPRDVAGALRLWREAAQRDIYVAADSWEWITLAMAETGRPADAVTFLAGERLRVQQTPGVPEDMRVRMLAKLARVEQSISASR